VSISEIGLQRTFRTLDLDIRYSPNEAELILVIPQMMGYPKNIIKVNPSIIVVEVLPEQYCLQC
jgi:hypothetical protein